MDDAAPSVAPVILVPGWYVTPQGRCDLVSRRRVEGALALLEAHPRATVVFSGDCNPRCFGKGREITEARAMYEYAVSLGMDPRRAYLEERATCTVENKRYGEALVQHRLGASTRWLVISSDFQRARHQIFFADQRYELVRVATRARSLWSLPMALAWLLYGTLTEFIKSRRQRRHGHLHWVAGGHMRTP